MMIPLRGALRRGGFFVAAAALAIGAAVAVVPKRPMASASSSGWVETWAAAPMKPTREVINSGHGRLHRHDHPQRRLHQHRRQRNPDPAEQPVR
jgi:hypothetical protein